MAEFRVLNKEDDYVHRFDTSRDVAMFLRFEGGEDIKKYVVIKSSCGIDSMIHILQNDIKGMIRSCELR